MIRHILAILFFAISSGLYGQKQVVLSSASSARKPDSVKKVTILKEWNLSADFSEEVSIPFDTTFSLFNRFKITDKYSPVNATLGNYGLPFYQLSFFDRITDPDKFLYSYYYPVMHLPDNAVFMNTQVPFTELVCGRRRAPGAGLQPVHRVPRQGPRAAGRRRPPRTATWTARPATGQPCCGASRRARPRSS